MWICVLDAFDCKGPLLGITTRFHHNHQLDRRLIRRDLLEIATTVVTKLRYNG